MKRKSCIIGISIIVLVVFCVVIQLISNLIPAFSSSKPKYEKPAYVDLEGGVHIYDISEYYDFIASEQKLPENFITAEMLGDFGSFYGFICDFAYVNNFSSYSYSLCAENGAKLTFHIHHKADDKRQNGEVLDITKISSDMTMLRTNENSIILRDGVEYSYLQGRLSGMNWEINGIEFDLTIFSPGIDYTALPENSHLKRMLSLSDADLASALNELTAITAGNDYITE